MNSSILSSFNSYTPHNYNYIHTKPLLQPKHLHFIKTPLNFPTKTSNINFIKIPKCLSTSNKDDDYISNLNQRFDFFCSFFSFGSWWSLSSYNINGSEKFPPLAKNVTVVEAFWRIWGLIEDDKWAVYVAFAALTVAALSEISIPAVLTMSIFSAQRGETAAFYRNAQFLAILCVSSGICSGLRSGCFAIANMTLVRRLRETLYDALLHQDIYFFDVEAVGDLTSRLGTDCQRLSRIIGNDLHLIIRNTLQGTGALINLLTLSRPLALSTLAICLILSTIFLLYGRYQKNAAKITQEFTAMANEVAEGTLSLIRVVRAYGTEQEELERFMRWLEKLTFVGVRETAAYGLWNLSFTTLYRSTQVIAVIFGGLAIIAGQTSAEQLTKYILYCEWLIYAAWRIQDNMSSLLQSTGACEKVFQLMNFLPSDQFLSEGFKLERLRGQIEFVDVSFHYPSRRVFIGGQILLTFKSGQVPVLENVNFSIKGGDVVAIVGPSGSGKSSLVNLILRLYEPTSGQILIDNFPLQDLNIRWLRGRIGFVGQEPHIFHMDIKSNITYGCYKAVSQEDIERAAKQAYAHHFISSLPHGYETLVDDNLLSGGQKQRIAIARAILRDPDILILDEATSALDAESEHYIKELIYSLKNGFKMRTIIIIAHRLSTIEAADRIMVTDSRQIAEVGEHQELLEKGGLYARLMRKQRDALI
ncbi:ATP-binding cassette [Lithospermum erythrorhizon]|uniref:ATP-binding cassette n=1 Tax=Lithospermum erythrorhizon TaxID=34254 RepID=A0AAV3QSW3_LITER